MKLKKKLKNKWLKILVGFAITTLALWLSFRKLDWEVLKETFFQVNFFWVILAVANTIFIVYALGWRWQILLKPKDKIALFSLFRLNIISQYVNFIIPGRFGEVLRAYLVSKQHKVSGGCVTGTIATIEPLKTIDYKGVDSLYAGEGEGALIELVIHHHILL